MDREIEVQLKDANGPKVLVTGEWDEAEIEAALPQGWTVGENFANGVKLSSGAWAYPLVRSAIVSLDNGQTYVAVDALTDEQIEVAHNDAKAGDAELREEAHDAVALCTPREYVAKYAEMHEAKHGSPWVIG